MSESLPVKVFNQNEQAAELVKGKDDVALLGFMADWAKDESLADQATKESLAAAAFKQFYDEHKYYVWMLCKQVTKQLRGEVWLMDIFNDTFFKAFDKASLFTVPPGTNAASITRLVHGWLGKIATNLLRNRLHNHQNEEMLDDEAWRSIACNSDIAAEVTATFGSIASNSDSTKAGDEVEQIIKNQKLEIIYAALASLSAKEQDIVRVTFQYYQSDKKFQRLPKDEVAELTKHWGISPANVRKIRERAMEKIKEYSNRIQSQTGP